jgi:hypothetical protein
MCAREDHLTEFEMAAAVRRLEKAVEAGAPDAVRQVFLDVVDGFCQVPQSEGAETFKQTET